MRRLRDSWMTLPEAAAISGRSEDDLLHLALIGSIGAQMRIRLVYLRTDDVKQLDVSRELAPTGKVLQTTMGEPK